MTTLTVQRFLGEALLLAGISFLLGTILAGLRQAGGEVQKAAGGPITVLAMSKTAKVRRIGVALYLTGITLGLVTTMRIIRFQAVRIRQLV